MAAIKNPTNFSLFSHVLMRSLGPGEVLDGVSDKDAEEACRSGVFERDLMVIPDEDEEKPKRPVGRPKSIRGAVEVEEVVVGDERETR